MFVLQAVGGVALLLSLCLLAVPVAILYAGYRVAVEIHAARDDGPRSPAVQVAD